MFGMPQDVEWAIGTDGTLWLLQSRPVTTEVRGIPVGPIYGPGPVAETFPEPLTELEDDLWVPPLRDAVREAVLLAGSATRAEVDASQVVVAVDGHVAIDLRLAGELVPKRTVAHRLNPIPAVHRLRGAWRVGRLRSAMPRLSERLLDRVDADLEAVPALDDLTSRQLIALLHRGGTILRALHAHEILMGMLTDTGQNRMTGASVALRVLVEARQDGLTDEEVLARSPIVLALTAPKVAPEPTLPPHATAIHLGSDERSGNDNGIIREALRLRVRWIQELSGRAAWELGERLAASGQLTEPELIRHMNARTRRSGRDEAGGRDPRARAVARPRLRCAAARSLPTVGPREGRASPTSRRRWAAVRPPAAESGADRSRSTPTIRRKGLCSSPRHSRPAWGRCCHGSTASSPKPVRSCHTSRSSPGKQASPRSSVTRRATEDLPEGAVVTVNGETGQVTIEGEESTP